MWLPKASRVLFPLVLPGPSSRQSDAPWMSSAMPMQALFLERPPSRCRQHCACGLWGRPASMSRRAISHLRARCRPGGLRGRRRAPPSSMEGSRRSAGGPGRMPPRSRCRGSSAGTWPIPRRGDAPSRISCRSQARTSSCSPGSGISGRRCGHAHRAWSAEIRAMGRPPAHMHRRIRPRRPGTGKDGARHMPPCASPLRASRRQPWRCRHMPCGSPPNVPVGRAAGDYRIARAERPAGKILRVCFAANHIPTGPQQRACRAQLCKLGLFPEKH